MTVTFNYPETPFSSHAETVGGYSHLFSSALGFQWLPAYGHLGHSHEGGSQSNRGGLTARTRPDVRDLDLHNKTL